MEPNLAVLPLSCVLSLVCVLPTTSTLPQFTRSTVCSVKSSCCVVQTDMEILQYLYGTTNTKLQTEVSSLHNPRRYHLCFQYNQKYWRCSRTVSPFATGDGKSLTAARWKEMEKFPAGKEIGYKHKADCWGNGFGCKAARPRGSGYESGRNGTWWRTELIESRLMRTRWMASLARLQEESENKASSEKWLWGKENNPGASAWDEILTCTNKQTLLLCAWARTEVKKQVYCVYLCL